MKAGLKLERELPKRGAGSDQALAGGEGWQFEPSAKATHHKAASRPSNLSCCERSLPLLRSLHSFLQTTFFNLQDGGQYTSQAEDSRYLTLRSAGVTAGEGQARNGLLV